MINQQSLVEVGISMVLRDNFSRESGKISQSFSTLMSDMRGLLQGFQASYGNFSQVGNELVSAMYDAYKYSAGVENQIFLTSKIAGATAQEAKDLFQTAQDINMETPLTAADIASGERYLAMAGKTASEIQDIIRPAAQLATIFGGTVGEKGGFADMMTNMMAMFNLPTKNTSRVADNLYTAVTSANMSMEDLMATIRYSGADMSSVGIGLNEVAAAAGALGDVGIQGSMAGTSLSNMIRNLQLSLAEQKKYGSSWLQNLGLSTSDFYDAENNFKGLYNAFQQFLKVYDQMDPLTRTQAFYNIFGVRGMRAIVPVLNAMSEGNDKMAVILTKMQHNSGALDQVMKEFLKTNQGAIEQFESALENWKVAYGQVVAPSGKFILSELLTPLLEWSSDLMKDHPWIGGTVKTVSNVVLIASILTGVNGILLMMQKVGNYVTQARTMGITIANSTSATSKTSFVIFRAMSIGFSAVENHLRINTRFLSSLSTNVALILRILQKQLLYSQGLMFDKNGQARVASAWAYNEATGRNGKRGQFATTQQTRPIGTYDQYPPGTYYYANWADKKKVKAPTIANPDRKGGINLKPGQGGGGSRPTSFITGWLPKIATGVGRIASIALRFTNILGIALMAIQILPWIWDTIKSVYNWFVGKDERDQREKNMRQRKEQAEAVWYSAINAGIRDGLRDSTIRIQVNGDNLNYSPGTTMDYTGAALIGQ